MPPAPSRCFCNTSSALQLLTNAQYSPRQAGLAAITHVCDCTGCGCRRSSPHKQPIQSSRQRALVPSLQRAAKVGAQRQPSGVQPARRGLHTGGEQLVPRDGVLLILCMAHIDLHASASWVCTS